jgi:hypothetical protein
LLAIHCSQPRFDRGTSSISKRFKSLKVTHDAKGRRKKFATPDRFRRISHNGLDKHLAEIAVPDTRTERAPVYSRSRLSIVKPAARLESRKCLKAIKLRLTLFLPPNPGFGESFCGSGAGHPH